MILAKVIIIIIIIIIIIGIQPLGRSGQRPEFSQATGMALVRCILGKFLGVVCHCFPPYTVLPGIKHCHIVLQVLCLILRLSFPWNLYRMRNECTIDNETNTAKN